MCPNLCDEVVLMGSLQGQGDVISFPLWWRIVCVTLPERGCWIYAADGTARTGYDLSDRRLRHGRRLSQEEMLLRAVKSDRPVASIPGDTCFPIQIRLQPVSDKLSDNMDERLRTSTNDDGLFLQLKIHDAAGQLSLIVRSGRRGGGCPRPPTAHRSRRQTRTTSADRVPSVPPLAR